VRWCAALRAPLIVAVAVAGLAVLAPPAAAKPPVCSVDAIQQALIDAGKLTQEAIDMGEVVDRVRCGDMTNDGDPDALFAIASGGTAGDTRFGVLRGRADGTPRRLVLWRKGYKVGVARRGKRSFEVIQPHYKAGEPNCCPSSFRLRRYTWRGHRFRVGKAHKLTTVPPRFYKP
jgi:hypothetical protein